MATAGKILMFPVGDWTSGNNYGFLDITYFSGSSYIAKTDITNSTIDPATDTENWQILAHGYIADILSEINGIDTSGLIGTAGGTVSSQSLIDKISDMVSDKLLPKTAISNQQVNDTATVTGSALSYSMNQSIIDLSGSFVVITGTLQSGGTTVSYPSGFTIDNSVVISAQYKHSGTTWRSGYGQLATNTPGRMYVELRTSDILFFTDSTDNLIIGRPFKIALMKK